MSGPQANRSDMHTDDLAMAPLGSCLMYDVLSDVEILRIQLWTEDWFRMVLEQKLTQWPHSITDAMVREIQVCYRSGLTPEEGVKYCFGIRS
jgi:hypothetical protein